MAEPRVHPHVKSGQSLCTAGLQQSTFDKKKPSKSPSHDYREQDTLDKKGDLSSGLKTSKLSGRYVQEVYYSRRA